MSDRDDRRSGRPLIGVGAVLLSDDLRWVLLIERGSPPAVGAWSIPGGLVERGETLREACLRELKEETGLEAELRGEVKVLERILGPAAAPRYHFLIIDFWGKARGGELRAGSDVRQARWVPLEAVGDLDHTTWGLEEVVRRAATLARGEQPTTALFVAAPADDAH